MMQKNKKQLVKRNKLLNNIKIMNWNYHILQIVLGKNFILINYKKEQ